MTPYIVRRAFNYVTKNDIQSIIYPLFSMESPSVYDKGDKLDYLLMSNISIDATQIAYKRIKDDLKSTLHRLGQGISLITESDQGFARKDDWPLIELAAHVMFQTEVFLFTMSVVGYYGQITRQRN